MQQNSRMAWLGSIPISWRITVFLYALVGVWYLVPLPPAMVEYGFSRTWYRWLLDWMTPLTQRFQIPLILVLIPLGFGCYIFFWTKYWMRIRHERTGSFWRGLSWGLKRLVCVLPILVLWFLVFWGAGYRRIPVEKRLHFTGSAISETDMLRLRGLLLDQVRGNMVSPQSPDPLRSIRAISRAMTRIVSNWDGKPIHVPARVKFIPAGVFLCNGTVGMCSPFTLEALVDRGLPAAAAVSSAAHELGHTAGFCAEDEASFVGYLAGLQAEDPFARYACSLYAYMDAIDNLSNNDFRKAFEALPDRARQDIREANEACRRYRVEWFRRISQVAYNRYLQTQGIDEGVRNYSHGITLLHYALCSGLWGRAG